MQEHLDSAGLLQAALDGQKPERVPCICPGGMMNMLTVELMERCGSFWPEAHTDAGIMADLASAVYEEGLFDNVGVPFCMTVEAEAMGASVILGGRDTEPRVSAYPLSSVAEWSKLSSIDLNGGRPLVVQNAIGLLKKRCIGSAVVGNLTGPISLASSLVDAAVFYKELRKKPEDAQALMDFVVDNLIAFGNAQIDAGADFIAISDPGGTGEILGPKLFEKYAVPALNRICEALIPRCKGVIVHICGQLRAIYPQLAMLKSKVISVDAIVSIKEMKAQLPDKIIMGNISTFALAAGKADMIRNLCRTCLKNGVDILSPACGLGTTTTVESIAIMMDAVKTAAREDALC